MNSVYKKSEEECRSKDRANIVNVKSFFRNLTIVIISKEIIQFTFHYLIK